MRTFHVGKMLPALAKANRIENIEKPPTPTLLCVCGCMCVCVSVCAWEQIKQLHINHVMTKIKSANSQARKRRRKKSVQHTALREREHAADFPLELQRSWVNGAGMK